MNALEKGRHEKRSGARIRCGGVFRRAIERIGYLHRGAPLADHRQGRGKVDHGGELVLFFLFLLVALDRQGHGTGGLELPEAHIEFDEYDGCAAIADRRGKGL